MKEVININYKLLSKDITVDKIGCMRRPSA